MPITDKPVGRRIDIQHYHALKQLETFVMYKDKKLFTKHVDLYNIMSVLDHIKLYGYPEIKSDNVLLSKVKLQFF